MEEENRDNGRYTTANEAWSKNWLESILLLMLRQWSSYGYELMEKMSTFGLAAMNPGTCYRTLRQLEKDGLVNSNWDTSKVDQPDVFTPSRTQVKRISITGYTLWISTRG